MLSDREKSVMRKITYCHAINEALEQAMEKDPRVFLMGEGVDDPRAIFGSTKGLKEKFGKDRVFDIPLAENSMTGVMIGAALAGMRPVMTHQRLDFTLYAMDQIVNHAAKRSYASGGSQCVPITIRAIVGRGWGQGPQHSQSLQALFSHVPGLKVVMPSTPYDVKGLLLAAIWDNNPVIFIEYRTLYDTVGTVPQDAYTVPIGEGVVRLSGTDVTIVAISNMVLEAVRARQLLERIGISAEVIDLRTLKPIDEAVILESVMKTGRLIVADTGWRTCGVAAEVAAIAAEKCFKYLKAPIRRVTLPDIPTPTSRALEEAYYPGFKEIAEAVCEVLDVGEKLKGEIFAASQGLKQSPEKLFLGPF